MSSPAENPAYQEYVPEQFKVSGLRFKLNGRKERKSSIVFQGSFTRDGEQIPAALKVAQQPGMGTLDREIAINAALHGKSEHIVPFAGYGVAEMPSGDHLVLAMDLFTEGSVNDRETSRLAPSKVVSYVEQTAAALDTVHTVGLVHRDVKPGNLLVAGEAVYLGDFGNATEINSDGRTYSPNEDEMLREGHSLEGMIYGTPLYMAPEQMHGVESDPRLDMHGLGITVYEMLVGEPFGDHYLPINQFLLEQGDKEKYETNANYSFALLNELGLGAFETPIRQAVSFDPDQRPSDPIEFAKNLAGQLAQAEHDHRRVMSPFTWENPKFQLRDRIYYT